ncbi:bifunctional NAD(P)/FAD-dependent oxidoreductase/class I SAM-dependent methyltransferase [Micromonospora sp. C28SCA-DRY-2]|uniref:bifunctional NAD(P)/FAD-dependent oxidoreductase/class I SAM-dependent methyltransferase n=1 Tax=Micromonospora sp. C28SCA-DRY-2 TaxID=3059522 RepID=UPI0026748A62|nr:bifunctional NAD(P)/FAD-dependent oxidoreductase/class I SAM-dependent methyltransferase [Micromonospora sp. C28SCA-DRY-2]MDO3705763.1 bifunctional NAD(P)/FAD-dependent oxidoreductase/class I SAM-dependent methyltransferase [Micromonospora sp. C28SCA-DRY-2]
MDDRYDVVVVGGGAAGLAGALALGRARRSVLVVDGGEPRNAPAAHMHNYLGRDGTAPGELLAAGRAEVTGYGGRIVAGQVVSAARDGAEFTVTLDDGRTVRARRLLVATGLVDELPEVPGLAQRWGRDVLHCPYCHGWEVRDRRIGVLATGPFGVHQAQLWRQWSEHVLLVLHGAAAPGAEETEQLAARAIPVVEGPVAGLEVTGDALTGVRLASGEVVELDALVVAPRFTARAGLLASLGLAPVEVEMGGHVFGSQIPADANGATAVPGVWVAGNVADVRAQVITSAGAGLTAGAAINADLVAEDTRAAVAGYRDRRETMFTEAAWEERYRSRPAVWSGRPNPQLVAEAAQLPPGRALDVGAGEGADAVWLAGRGWQVTAVDISTTALERAAAHADTAGAAVAGRIEWVHADLLAKPPAADSYDLVSAQFMQLPPEQRQEMFARLAAAVAPGGTLLIVGHHPSDLRTSAHRLHFPEMMFTAEEVAAGLDPGRWQVLAAETRPRAMVNPEGREITIHDAVLVARRR